MDENVASLLDFAAQKHAALDYPATPAAFARAAGIRLIPADEDGANAGPPCYVTYNERYGLSRRRFTLWHEIAHILMSWHGIDEDIDLCVDEIDREVLREQIANLVAGQLMIPRNVFQKAIKKYGWSPHLLAELEHSTGMSQGVCMRRAVLNDLSASRAVAVVSGGRVIDVAAHNYNLPIYRASRVPEPDMKLGGATLEQFGRRIIAVWEE